MQEILIKLFADGAVIPVVLIGAWELLFKVERGNRFHAYSRVLMAGLTAYLFAKLIGSVFQPEMERPFELLGTHPGAFYLNNPGFPSDHILFCTAITLAVWFETKQKKVSILLAALTVAVAVARVLALVHSPLDVIGGAVIASLGALWYLQRDTPIALARLKQWSKPQERGKIS